MFEFWMPVTVVLLAASIAAVTDVWMFRVHNVLTLPLIVSGLVYHAMFGGWGGLFDSFLGASFGLLVLLLPYLLGLMGAGDVKLLAGVGAWLGLPATVLVFVVSSLVAGVYATVLIVLRGRLRESFLTLKLICYRFTALGMQLGKDDLVESLAVGPEKRFRVIPYGAMIPVGIIGTVLWNTLLR